MPKWATYLEFCLYYPYCIAKAKTTKKLSNAGKIFQIILKAMLMSTLTSYTVQN